MADWRILVTGSRNWRYLTSLYIALDQAAWLAPSGSRIVLVHGTCRGADLQAEHYALSLGWEIEAHPADWDQHGKAAGFLRNAEMVRAGADICVAAIRDHSRGTTQCSGLAHNASIPILWIRDCACHPMPLDISLLADDLQDDLSIYKGQS